jgi:hypothetical protein
MGTLYSAILEWYIGSIMYFPPGILLTCPYSEIVEGINYTKYHVTNPTFEYIEEVVRWMQ